MIIKKVFSKENKTFKIGLQRNGMNFKILKINYKIELPITVQAILATHIQCVLLVN